MIKMLGHYWDGAGEPRGMHKLQDLCILLGSLTPSLWVCRPTVSMRPLLSMLFELPLVFLAFWPMIKMLNSDARYWDGVSEPRDMHKHRYCASYLAH